MNTASTWRGSWKRRAAWIAAAVVPLGLGAAVFQAGKSRPRVLAGLDGTSSEVAYAPDGTLACISSREIVHGWIAMDGLWRRLAVSPSLFDSGFGPARLRFSPDGKRLYAGGSVGESAFKQPSSSAAWSTQSRDLLFTFNASPGRTFDISADGATATLGDRNAVVVRAINKEAGLSATKKRGRKSDDKRFVITSDIAARWANTLALSPDGSRVAECGTFVSIFDVATGRRVSGSSVMPGASIVGEPPLNDAAWSPDGSWLAVATTTTVLLLRGDGFIHAQAPLLPHSTTPNIHRVRPLAWSPDSRRLAVGGPDVRLFSAPGLKPERVLAGAGGVAFSPDGSKLATGHAALKGVLEWRL